jgi:O-antigen/teichoic acid export membrane protein
MGRSGFRDSCRGTHRALVVGHAIKIEAHPTPHQAGDGRDGRRGVRPLTTAESEVAVESSDRATRRQIRGSGLLLAGKGLALGLKFVAELIVVRYLTTEDYGSWTYALAAVTFLRGMSALGLHRALSRYLPLHLERREFEQFYGVLVFVFGAILLAGALIVTAFYAFPGEVASLAGIATERPLALLFIVIFLVPTETVDTALMGVSAAFGDSRTIFVRRFLMHPGLRISVAGLLVLMQADVTLLAYGYLLSGVVGIAYYAWSVANQMRKRGLLKWSLLRGVRLPVRRVLAYTTPVMAADWCSVYMITAGPLLLGYFSDMSAVALYQVVVPAAALNTVVYQSFGMLFEPSASRLSARDDPAALNHHYWRSAVWVAVLTFPLFALSFTAAVPLTVLLYGERYVAAAPILSLLAAGQFIDSAAGFNSATLRVTGQVRWLVVIHMIGAAVTIGISVLLIPSMGAVGAGIGTAVGLLLYTILKQIALQQASGVHALDGTYKKPYLTIAGVTLALLMVRLIWPDNFLLVVLAAALGSIAVFLSARVTLSISETFPELGRSPLLRKILG